jgi:hypothetical protein
MPIPIEKKRTDKIDREIRKLQAERTGATKDVRRLLQKAMLASIQSDNGVDGAGDKVRVLLDAAIDRGLAKSAITDGPGMTGRIAELLDRTPSLDHAAGLLYEAADLLTEAGHQDAAAVLAIAESINTAANVEQWRTVSRPHVQVLLP